MIDPSQLRHIRAPGSLPHHAFCKRNDFVQEEVPCVKYGTWHTATCKACLSEIIYTHKYHRDKSKFIDVEIELMTAQLAELQKEVVVDE